MKVKKINLLRLNEIQLDKKKQQLIFGGNACKCGSCSENTSTFTNMNANYNGNITGTGTANPACMCNGEALRSATYSI
ncbi:hypothetical protein AGMMS50239_19450 [Bacteroidia bacterium]|nr:hypothetical protein AGMMS50239_19450 [Bacteroidia bacterium]